MGEQPGRHVDPMSVRDRVEASLLHAATATGGDAEAAQLVTDLAQAEALSLRLVDRLRAATGHEVALSMATSDSTAQRPRGVVEFVGVDHVVLRTDSGLIAARLGGVVSVVSLGQGAQPAQGLAGTWTWRATLRRWITHDVSVYLVTSGSVRGPLLRVAADHLDVGSAAGPVTVAWDHVTAVVNTNVHDLDVDEAFEV